MFFDVWELERFQTAKVTSKVIQGHCQCAIRQAAYDFLLEFHGNYAVLEVGRYETVCHTGTSLDGYKSYRRFHPEKYHTGMPQ